MANLDSATKGSLAEFDLMISIREEAINRQLQLLYNEPVHKGHSLPPPPGIRFPSGETTKPSQYLINHELVIPTQYTDEDDGSLQFDPENGLFGHVKCPTVSLRNDDLANPNIAKISYTFERVDGLDQPDSVFRTWVGVPPRMRNVSTIVNGYSISWSVKLDKYDFGDVEQELVLPAQNNLSSVIAHHETVSSLSAVNPEQFSVSSIFCIFDNALIAQTFEIRDEKGQLVTNTTSKYLNELVNHVTRYFADLQRASPTGIPTADNPFVLGYGLSQKVPDLRTINPNIDTSSTPKYFIPRGYKLSVTPGIVHPGGRKQDSPYTRGTLNFCLLTFREHDDPHPIRTNAKIDRNQNANAGKLTETLFDVTKISEHDGVMGFAQDLIWSKYLAPMMLKAYHISSDVMIGDTKNVPIQEIQVSGDHDRYDDGNQFKIEREQKFSYKALFKWSSSDDTRGRWLLLTDDYYQTKGTCLTTVSWTSDLQTDANFRNVDALRRVYITVESVVAAENKYVDTGHVGDITYTSRFKIAMRWVWEVSAGKGGVIDMRRLEDQCKLPEIYDGNKIKWTSGERPDGAYGAYFSSSDDRWKELTWVKSWIYTDGVDPLSWVATNIQTRIKDSLESNINTAVINTIGADFDSLKNRVIMPAGNVFNYAGVNIDSQGNMLAHISFALGKENVSTVEHGTPTAIRT